MSRRPLFSFPPSFGSYLAVVFEFLGFLALGGVAGFVAQTYIWPEYSSWIFPVIFIAMFLLGLWFMVRQTKRLSEQEKERKIEQKKQEADPELSPELVERRMKEFDERFRNTLKIRSKKSPSGES